MTPNTQHILPPEHPLQCQVEGPAWGPNISLLWGPPWLLSLQSWSPHFCFWYSTGRAKAADCSPHCLPLGKVPGHLDVAQGLLDSCCPWLVSAGGARVRAAPLCMGSGTSSWALAFLFCRAGLVSAAFRTAPLQPCVLLVHLPNRRSTALLGPVGGQEHVESDRYDLNPAGLHWLISGLPCPHQKHGDRRLHLARLF